MHGCFVSLVVAALWMGGIAQAQAQEPAGAEQPTPAGAAAEDPVRISLDLKGVDILDVLKLLSQKSGLSFVAGRNVAGRVTIFANDVDVWEAFTLIVNMNGLAYERQGNVISVMAARDYELKFGEAFDERKESEVHLLQYARAAEVATVVNQLKSSVGQVVADENSNTLIVKDVPDRLQEIAWLIEELDRPTQTRVYQLNYTVIEDIQEKVEAQLTPVGSATFDARTGQIVVTDQIQVLERLDRIMSTFDVPEGEVLIDAKIIKVELTDKTQLGIDWERVLGGIDSSVRGNERVLSDIIGGTGKGTAFVMSKPTARLVLEALQSLGKTETLSNPRILVANSQEAKILVGTREAFVTTTTTVPTTGSVVTAPEIEFVDVGTKLFVTPSVKRDGFIQMKVRPEVSTASVEVFQNNRIPILTTTEAETVVLVKSGYTLLLGGLINSKVERTESRMPILGRLPVVGAGFRGTTDTVTKTELVLLLTPEIILPDGRAYEPAEPPEPHIPKADGPAADEAARAEGLPEGLVAESVEAAYDDLVRRHLERHLQEAFASSGLPDGSVEVAFRLGREGQVLDATEIRSPQGEAFVLAAESALAKAEPFPAFPEATEERERQFTVAVHHASLANDDRQFAP